MLSETVMKIQYNCITHNNKLEDKIYLSLSLKVNHKVLNC